ncbi:hypothetical protein GCM10008090_07680 [Arenicella chitinivorans]|uniref:Histidine kinase domain-containing protein n=1 Tax=Arenicella chitinivorans TaxID=1329800 RepID=A0A918RKZ1_9GAMM|nr:histidine kinase [Arenicella chitinivorans]GHA01052.1 hypothetical protein GCM10008090_07680 [Arenicella chitinivorans]
MSTPHIPLDKELPFPDRWRWGYQHYPVFSWAWWRGRLFIFGLGALALTLMTGMGSLMDFDDNTAAIITTLKFGIGVFGMIFFGATAMTLARENVVNPMWQRVFVTVGLMIGLMCAVLMDAWSSREIEHAFAAHSQSRQAIESMLAQQGEIETRRWALIDAFMVFGIYFWCAGGIAFIRYWREPGMMQRWQMQQELSQARANQHDAESRLSILQAQIEPHFLFNTLAALKSVLRSEPDRAEAAIDDLVDYLRASIPRFNQQQQLASNSLSQQVTLCEKYLALMQLRMGTRLRFDTRIEPELGSPAFPPLILISLVENAIKHGLEPKEHGGEVAIHITTAGTTLHIEVADTGVGLNADRPTHTSGLGLKNIRDQLKLLYPDRATLDLAANPAGGVIATITITDFLSTPL